MKHKYFGVMKNPNGTFKANPTINGITRYGKSRSTAKEAAQDNEYLERYHYVFETFKK